MTDFVAWAPLTVFTAMVWLVTALVAVITLLVALWRPSYPGWRTWTVGHSSLVLGFMVSAARTEGSLQVSVLLGNGLVMAGAALYLNAFQRFCGEAPGRREVNLTTAAGLAVLLALWFLTTIRDDILLRHVHASCRSPAVPVPHDALVEARSETSVWRRVPPPHARSMTTDVRERPRSQPVGARPRPLQQFSTSAPASQSPGPVQPQQPATGVYTDL
ncbi:hypothetical protein [Deinococcus marmoris]|uniref:hypothetical protein n=1 Tax=Deinococcus marmoris TaxID=249408 RepID=UPI00049867E0|nr:hypothetical protein [Deinococcus marmoris]